MRKKIIVFGGSGFLGRHFLGANKTHELFCINRGKYFLPNAKKNFTYKSIKNIVSYGPYDFAIDFSSSVSVENYLKSPIKAFLNNIKIPINNLDLLNKINFTGRYLLISSDRALVENSGSNYLNSQDINVDPYGASKYVAEIIVTYASNLNWATPTILTFPNIYGPFQTSSQLVPKIVGILKTGKNIVEINSFQGSRNYLYVEDAINAIKAALDMSDGQKRIAISGYNLKIKEILITIEKLMKEKFDRQISFKSLEKITQRSAYKLPPNTLNDLSFRKKSGWQPRFNINDGLQKLLQEEFKCQKID